VIRSYKDKVPQIHETTFISESAYVVGDVVIGAGSSVWPGAVIRGDVGRITIGNNTVIQDNCVVHLNSTSWIGNGVLLGHGVVWHGRKLGDDCLVGNNATVMGEVEVGANSVIAAGTVVPENAIIPSGSLVKGVPGKVVGPTKEHHQAFVRRAVKHYVQEAQNFKEAGL
jgi:carbonic anhydrase/acetyltransferase-like protein (isoleucine patch superfamily)